MKNKLLIGLLLLSMGAKSQTAVTNTGILHINTSSDIFYAGSDFTNTSAAALTNNGALYVKGNLTNNQASMTAGTSGTLYLSGTSAQSVGGTASFKTYNLNTNNSVTGSNAITINTNLSIAGTHTFAAGVIGTASSKYLVYEDNATHTGSSNAAHVNGWVKKIGDDNFTFPVGNLSYLREIAMSGLSSSSEYNAQYSGTTTNTSNLQSPLVSINPNEYWSLEKISGTGNIAVTLNWSNAKVAFPNYVLTDIRAAQYTAGNWTNLGANNVTGAIATSGTITSDPFSFTGNIPLSIGSVSTMVPLNFLSVSAKRINDQTLIEWKTANEIDVKQHEVQRSTNAGAFISIASIPAKNSLNEERYNFTDAANLSGTVYYRIKSVDIDGKLKYSKVVSININPTNESIVLKNNPVHETINLALTGTAYTSYGYQLINTNGNVVQKGNLQYAGTGSLGIALQPVISAGSYILIMSNGTQVFTQKIIVQ